MTILKSDPLVTDNPQIDPVVKTREKLSQNDAQPPLFTEQHRSVLQKLAAFISKAVFTAGLYLKFIGGNK